jgi:hypothetical protein
MNPERERKILKVKGVKNYPFMIFSILWILIFIVKLNSVNSIFLKSDYESYILGIAIYIFTGYNFYQLMWAFFGETYYIVCENNFTVNSGIFFIRRIKIYLINQITDVRIKNDVKSSTYWGFLGFRFYSENTSAITFMYKRKNIVLEVNSAGFDLSTLKDWIS